MVMTISLPVFLLMSADMLFMILILSLKRIARRAEFSSLLGNVNFWGSYLEYKEEKEKEKL